MAYKRELVQLKNILHQSLKHCQLEPVWWLAKISSAWEEIVGERVSKKAEPVKLRNKILTIQAANSAWMSELQMMKPMILEKIRAHFKEIPLENIRFIT